MKEWIAAAKLEPDELEELDVEFWSGFWRRMCALVKKRQRAGQVR